MTDLLVDKLAEAGIRLRSYDSREHHLTCPQCSAGRKPHNRKKTCLSVKLDHDGGAVWMCHHCEWHGNVPGQLAEGGARRSAPARKAVRPGKQLPARPSRPEPMMAFFAGRGISEETVERFEIYLGRQYFPQVEKTAHCITFPYRHRGEIVSNKYRHPQKHFVQDKDAQRTVYNVDALVDNDVAIWAEGEMDVLALDQAGMPNGVSLPDGAPKKHKEEIDRDDKRYWPIRHCADLISPIKKHILATDGDGPGDALAYQLAHRLGPERCFRVRWPSGCKDANEVLIRHGPDTLRSLIETARGFPLRGLVEIHQGQLVEFRSSPRVAQYRTGLQPVDDLLRFRTKQVIVVTGWPGSGKSELVDFVTVELTRRYGWSWAICSPEHETEDQAGKLAEKWKGQPFLNYGPEIRAMSDEDLSEAEAWVGANYSFIVEPDEDMMLTVDWILEKARTAWLRHGIKGLVIDPYNEIAHDRGQLSETDYVGQLMRRLLTFARNHDLVVFLIVHPTKLGRDREGKRPRPSVADAAGSANFHNKASIAMTVHRPDPESEIVEVMVEKMKRKDQGRMGVIKLRWDKYSGLYKAPRTAGLS